MRVTRSSHTRRVLLARLLPRSLKPMWPVRPRPSSCGGAAAFEGQWVARGTGGDSWACAAGEGMSGQRQQLQPHRALPVKPGRRACRSMPPASSMSRSYSRQWLRVLGGTRGGESEAGECRQASGRSGGHPPHHSMLPAVQMEHRPLQWRASTAGWPPRCRPGHVYQWQRAVGHVGGARREVHVPAGRWQRQAAGMAVDGASTVPCGAS